MPGRAVRAAVAPEDDPGPAAAAAFARYVGRHASEGDLAWTRRVVEMIERGHRAGPPFAARGEAAQESSWPNLVFDLAGAVREAMAPELAERGGDLDPLFWAVPKVQPPDQSAAAAIDQFGGVSIDAVAATVAAVFSSKESAPAADSARTIFGAALLALSVADAESAEQLREAEGPTTEIRIKAPWEVSHPVLLDPLMWMVLTGYRFAG